MFFIFSGGFSLGGHQSILLSEGESDLIFTSPSFDVVTRVAVLGMPRTVARNLISIFRPSAAFVGSISGDIPYFSYSAGEQPIRRFGGNPTMVMLLVSGRYRFLQRRGERVAVKFCRGEGCVAIFWREYGDEKALL
ncbi:unnamed protein product [Linum trigynum]|uniref:Uncharacterized protein n=1 Tax=Linum trigynum TaxID=586398 RepID=A0AAV2G590_9ROSI